MATAQKRNPDKLKQDLKRFDEWSRRFMRLEPELAGGVRCPICWKAFERESVLTSTLTREHIVPAAILRLTQEPKLFGVTCQDCNSRAGTWGHAAMRNVAEAKLFLAGVFPGPVNATVSFDKQPVQRIELTVTDKHISLVGISKQNDPRIIQQIIDHLEELVDRGTTDWGFELQGKFDGLTPRARYGFLYSAYMLVFCQTDAEYGYTPAAQSVRELLNSEPLESFPQCVIDINVPKTGMTPWHANVDYEAMGKSIWASIALMVVMLPTESDVSMECYRTLESTGSESHFGIRPPKSKFRFSIRGVSDARMVLQNLPSPMNVSNVSVSRVL